MSDFEDQIFMACNEPSEKRDWTTAEKEFIGSSEITRRILVRWLRESKDLSIDCWTPQNERFIEDLMKEGSL